jgi:hypothetical protein
MMMMMMMMTALHNKDCRRLIGQTDSLCTLCVRVCVDSRNKKPAIVVRRNLWSVRSLWLCFVYYLLLTRELRDSSIPFWGARRCTYRHFSYYIFYRYIQEDLYVSRLYFLVHSCSHGTQEFELKLTF